MEQSMPWNPGKQWHTPELHSPLPWQLRGHSCTESVKMTKKKEKKVRQEAGGRGRGVEKEGGSFDGEHQSGRLNLGQHSSSKSSRGASHGRRTSNAAPVPFKICRAAARPLLTSPRPLFSPPTTVVSMRYHERERVQHPRISHEDAVSFSVDSDVQVPLSPN